MTGRFKRFLTFDIPGSPSFWAEFHKWATIVWMFLIIPSILWWGNMLMWVILMSLWANIAGHWSAYQACEAQCSAEEST